MSKTTRRVFVVLALAVSLFFLLPLSLHAFLASIGVAQSAKAAAWVTLVVAAGAAVGLGWALRRDIRRARKAFLAAEDRRAVKRGSFKCVVPEILGQFVVFPVRVERRGQLQSRIVALDDDALRVDLSTDHGRGHDSAVALKALLEAALLPHFHQAEIVAYQGKDAGPTGLAAGLALNTGRKDLNLGLNCGRMLMDLASGCR